MRGPRRCGASGPLLCAAGLLAAPRVFRAPEGPAAREARRPHFVRRRASKPARALRTLRRPPHRWCCVAWSSPARPRHRPRHRSQAHQSLRRLRCSPRRQQRRFCTTRSPLAACRRRVGPPCSAIPPVWWLRGSALRGRGRPTKAISHVIPRRLLHSLNYHHWNCNVCRLSQKVTALNYVRLLEEAAPDICHGTTCIKGHFQHH